MVKSVNSPMTREQTEAALASKRRFEKGQKIVAMALVYLLLLVMYLPILYLIVFSFTNSKVVGAWSGFSLDSYKFLFNMSNKTSKAIWDAVLNTVSVAVVAGALSTLLGTMGAIGMYYLKKKWVKNTMDFVTQIPVVNAEIVMGVSLCVLFVFSNIERSYWTLIAGHIVLSIPFVVMSVEPKLRQMDPSLYEAAMDLGCTPFQALIKVIIPDIVPGILSGFMLSVTLSLDDYIITAFTKPTKGGFDTISTYVENVTKKDSLPIQLRAFTTILFAAILIFMIVATIRGEQKAKKGNK